MHKLFHLNSKENNDRALEMNGVLLSRQLHIIFKS